MSVWHDTTGQGPDLVLLHGWGMNAEVWRPVLPALQREFRVTLIELPGHGRSAPLDGVYDLTTLALAVAEVAPAKARWLGWSLGGMVALQLAASFTQRVTKLLLVAGTPRFVQDHDWPWAVGPQVLTGFAEQLEQDYRATLLRFLALQMRGASAAREDTRRLRELLFTHGEPDPAALRGGLHILREADLRAQLTQVRCPVLWIGGQHDTLVPAAAGQALAEALPAGRSLVVQGAAHAPFISHPDGFVAAVTGFLHDD